MSRKHLNLSNRCVIEKGLVLEQSFREIAAALEQLAERADISTDFLGLVEKGQQSMKIQNMAKLAKALDTTTDYLIYGSVYYDDFPEINSMLAVMSEDEREQVEKLITLFLDSIRKSVKANADTTDSDSPHNPNTEDK